MPLFILIVIVILFKHFDNIFTYRSIISIFVALFCIFIVFKLRSQSILNNFVKYKNNVGLIANNSLTYLLEDIDILNIYVNIIEFRKFNPISFNESLKNMNFFLKSYDEITNTNLSDKFLFENALYRRNISLNYLLSMVINLPINSILIQSNETLHLPNDVILRDAVEKLRNITSKYILDMQNRINNTWKNEDTNIFSTPIYAEDPRPNPYSDRLFSKYIDIF